MSTKLTKGENGKKAITFFQQHNFRVVQLEFDKRPLSKMIPTNLLQHPMSGKPTWLPGYILKLHLFQLLTQHCVYHGIVHHNSGCIYMHMYMNISYTVIQFICSK